MEASDRGVRMAWYDTCVYKRASSVQQYLILSNSFDCLRLTLFSVKCAKELLWQDMCVQT